MTRSTPKGTEAEHIAITDEVVNYIARFGGMCRDCADEDGICPSSGLPCSGTDKAIRHVLTAVNYGYQHGYLKPDPTPIGGEAVSAVERLSRFVEQGDSGFDVYPGGIFMVEGPNQFFIDLRTALSALSQAEAGKVEAEKEVGVVRDGLRACQELVRDARAAADREVASADTREAAGNARGTTERDELTKRAVTAEIALRAAEARALEAEKEHIAEANSLRDRAIEYAVARNAAEAARVRAVEAIETFICAYRRRYSTVRKTIRPNAPLRAEAAELHQAWIALVSPAPDDEE